MAIMMGNKPVIAFKGDHEPVQMAKGNNKVTGWRRELLSGTELSFYNTYKDSVSLSIEGRTDVSDEVYREKSGNTVVVPATEHSKPYPDKVIVSGNTVQMSDWYGINGQSSQYTDTKLGTVNIIDTESLENVEYLGSGSFRASSWAQRILSNNKVLKVFKPSTTYYFKAKYTLETISNLPVYQRTVGFNLHSSATGSLNFGSCATLDMVGESIEMSGTFTTPSTIGDKALLFYSNRYTDGATVELDTVKVEKFIISEVNVPYEPYKDTVKNGLVLEYNGKNFFNTPQTTSLKDRSGNGNHGAPYGFAYNSTSGSDGNGGIVFDGVDDYIKSPMIDIYESTTWEVVIKAPTTPRSLFILDQREAEVGVHPIYTDLNGRMQFYVNGNGSSTLLTSTGVFKFDGQTHHIVAIGTATSKKLYYDGTLVASDTVGILARQNTPIHIGTRHTYTAFFNGTINAIRVYNRALSESEIYQNYMAGTSLNMPSPEDPSPVLSNLPSGTYKYTSTDGVYEFTVGEELRGIGSVTDKVVFDRVSKNGRIERGIGDVNLNGTKVLGRYGSLPVQGITKFILIDNNIPMTSNTYFGSGLNIICDKFKAVPTGGGYSNMQYKECISDYLSAEGLIYGSVFTDRLSSDTTEGLIEFFNQNPVNIKYKLRYKTKSPLTFTKVSSSTAPEVPMQFITSEVSPDYPAEMYDVEEGNIIVGGKNLVNDGFETIIKSSGTSKITLLNGNVDIANTQDPTTAVIYYPHEVFLRKGVDYTLSKKPDMVLGQSLVSVGFIPTDKPIDVSNFYTTVDDRVLTKFGYTGSDYTFTPIWTGYYRLGVYLAYNRTAFSINNIGFNLSVGSSSSAYESFKPQTKSTTPLLRKVGTVADTYNPLTGEYVQRVGVKVFDGSDLLTNGSNPPTINTEKQMINVCIPYSGVNAGSIGIGTHFKHVYPDQTYESVSRVSNYYWINLNFSTIGLTNETDPRPLVNSYFVKQNSLGTPVKILFPLATPVVTYLEPNLVPLYDVDTYIESDSAIAQPDITVGYELKDGVATNINDITEPHPDYPRVIDGVGEYDAVNDDYNLEVYSGVGGVNLMRKTNTTSFPYVDTSGGLGRVTVTLDNDGILSITTTAILDPYYRPFGALTPTIKRGVNYVFSGEVLIPTGATSVFKVRALQSMTGNYTDVKNALVNGLAISPTINAVKGTWSKFEVVIKWDMLGSKGVMLSMDVGNTTIGETLKFKNLKIEEKESLPSTPWTPAPEDIQYNTPTNNTFKTLHNFPVELNRVGDIADQYTPPFWGAGYDGDGRNLLFNTAFSGKPNKYLHNNMPSEGGFRYYYDQGHMFMKPKQGEKYTISMRVRGDCNIGFYMISPLGNHRLSWINKTQLSTTEYRDFSLTFTPHRPELTEVYICTDWRATAYTEWFEIEPCSLKIERGSSPTPWTPSSGEFVQRIGKKELVGNEAWYSHNGGVALGNWCGKLDARLGANNVLKGYRCTHFKEDTAFADGTFSTYFMTGSETNWIIMKNRFGSDVAGFKTWLSKEKLLDTPVTVYYALQTPILSTITGSAIPTFYPFTKVETITAGTKPKLHGTARVVDLLETDF